MNPRARRPRLAPRIPLDGLPPFALDGPRPLRLWVRAGAGLDCFTGRGLLRPDGWVEFRPADWAALSGRPLPEVRAVDFPPDPVELIEWLRPDPLGPPPDPDPAFLDFAPARLLAVVCGAVDQLTGLAARRGVWLDFRPAGPWRLRPARQGAPEVLYVTLPRRVVHLVEWLDAQDEATP